ncbi:MAG: glycosyltransferase family 4 protein [Bacteroidales bacterium]|nr:glycosyltransferase family 4 protein [Bacteroidales bacterium]
MKVAIVSFGHADSIISLPKYLVNYVNVDLYFAFSLDRKRNNIIDFTSINVQPGLQNNETSQKVFSNEIKKYIENKFGLKLFIYKNLKFKSFKNWILSYKFSRVLKKYDIIHFNGDHAVLPQLILFLIGKKKVFTIHDFYPHSGEGQRNIIQNFLRWFQTNSKYPIILQNKNDYNQFFVNSKVKKNKVFFVPFGYLEIYKSFLNSNIKINNKSDILFFGRISPYKGIEYLLEAFKIVLKKYPKLKLLIVGSGNIYFDKKYINETSNITLINRFIDSHELVSMIKTTKLVVCPYTDATQSGVAMTAFAFNKPVVATNTGGFKDVIINSENGYLVPQKDSISLAETIIKIFSHRDELIKLENNINKFSEKGIFAWKNIAKSILDIYKR